MIVETQDGVALHVSRKGEGTPCLYLHGEQGYWSDSFEHFAGPFLEEELEMIYLDQRGCGRSDHSSNEDYSLDRLILDLEDVRRSLNIDEWLVMGHSSGGLLAVNYAYRFPERVKGLLLTNCTEDKMDSLTHQIKYIDAPTLVMSRQEDHTIGYEHYHRFQFPNQTTEIFEDKHHPYLENQVSFQQAISSFIKQIPTEAVKI